MFIYNLTCIFDKLLQYENIKYKNILNEYNQNELININYIITNIHPNSNIITKLNHILYKNNNNLKYNIKSLNNNSNNNNNNNQNNNLNNDKYSYVYIDNNQIKQLDKYNINNEKKSKNYIITEYFNNIKTIIDSKISINNTNLKNQIIFIKNKINKNIKNWDKVKTITNDYEFVCINNCKLLEINNNFKHYYSKILYFNYFQNKVRIDSYMLQLSKLLTLSRSFYKMIEIINYFFSEFKMISNPITSLHLAEGPGGFIEAINYIRNNNIYKNKENKDLYYGITLLDKNKNDIIPSWKKSTQFLKNNSNIKIITGIDNKGDLLNPNNIKYLYSRFKNNKCNFITADGGIDFSYNIKSQEEMASKLIYAQIIAAIGCLEINGHFVLKIFDMNNILTIDMLFLLYLLFNNIYIYKPKTSRLANSEKYLICIGFKGCDENFKLNLITLLDNWNKNDIANDLLINNYIKNKTKNLKVNFNNYNYKQANNIVFNPILNDIKLYFYEMINNINKEIIEQQIKNINYTLNFCKLLNNKKLYIKTINNRLIIQTINATKWCKDNNIPFYKKNYLK
jgi:hypothetical protein